MHTGQCRLTNMIKKQVQGSKTSDHMVSTSISYKEVQLTKGAIILQKHVMKKAHDANDRGTSDKTT